MQIFCPWPGDHSTPTYQSQHLYKQLRGLKINQPNSALPLSPILCQSTHSWRQGIAQPSPLPLVPKHSSQGLEVGTTHPATTITAGTYLHMPPLGLETGLPSPSEPLLASPCIGWDPEGHPATAMAIAMSHQLSRGPKTCPPPQFMAATSSILVFYLEAQESAHLNILTPMPVHTTQWSKESQMQSQLPPLESKAWPT